MSVRPVKLCKRFKFERPMKLAQIGCQSAMPYFLHSDFGFLEGTSKSLSRDGVLSISAKGFLVTGLAQV